MLEKQGKKDMLISSVLSGIRHSSTFWIPFKSTSEQVTHLPIVLIALTGTYSGLFWLHLLIMKSSMSPQSKLSTYLLIYFIRCMISLIRGIGSNFPCPICLVPANQQTNLSTIFPQRTMKNMQEIYLTAQKLASGPKDELLKSYGLRDAEVCQARLISQVIHEFGSMF